MWGQRLKFMWGQPPSAVRRAKPGAFLATSVAPFLHFFGLTAQTWEPQNLALEQRITMRLRFITAFVLASLILPCVILSQHAQQAVPAQSTQPSAAEKADAD